MKKLVILLAVFVFISSFNKLQAQEIKPAEVKQIMKKAADWQIDHFRDCYSGREVPHHPLAWTNAALYIGMLKWADMADDDSYFNWLKKIGEEKEWMLHRRQYHADDHTVGQMYLELYRKYKDEKMIEPTKKQFNFIMYHPSQSVMNWGTPFHQDRWDWCDALFMAPPVWAKLYNITGEKQYLDYLMHEYRATTDFLFDKKEHFYYRDERYKGKLDNGTKIFWSRGNGWVFAGLVNILVELEPQSKEYNYFHKIYKKMAAKLLKVQTPEGHWAMSLLGQEFYPTPETSGSSFFVYGLSWGINNGILDKDDYLPSVEKGWNALVSHVTDDGMIGYVQPIGGAPGNAWVDKTEVYGTGAFLSAGSEVYKLFGGK